MDKPTPASDLERRKQVKIRLRPDLDIAPQKYEGKTFFVVKDPVSLRYYRFKDQENFLLEYMDGQHTLDDAQKAFEKRFRPDRLTLEDLEHFAQQLLTAGLAQNESPQAGKQLFDRRKKRRRSEWMQTLTNILYIKIPVFDPDKLLTGMLKYLWWIFTVPFALASVALMLSAALLVATHFESFREKLPSYHEFFSFKTIIYLWIALGVVKVIHEFGHGLSCKAFGGEVHEMGLLFLCLSPCLYCNVSDAWTLPNKWKRIIISAAGIWVELIIASIATFVWWNTPSQPFVNNLALCVMIVCSVSTVVFNANPLMRYDGYYVLLDWLEIPNLRDRCNRYMQNVVMEHCLGMEVQPEPYMALDRRVLFITYAIASYVYRWIVTYSILYFMYSFLKPYKLGVISAFMALFAAGSMAGWPLYRLGKNLYKRGRVPDMKKPRVIACCVVVAVLVAFFFLVPLPVSRVRSIAVVQVIPDSLTRVYVPEAAVLEKILVEDGQTVEKDTPLAELRSREVDSALLEAKTQLRIRNEQILAVADQLRKPLEPQEEDRLKNMKVQLEGERNKFATEVEGRQKKKDELTLRAPMAGVIMGCPRVNSLGKLWEEKELETPFCSIGDPTKLRVTLPVVPHDHALLAQDKRDLQESLKNHTAYPVPWLGVLVTDRGIFPMNDPQDDLGVTIRVQGRESLTWKGKLEPLPEQEAKEVPAGLTHKGGGPLAIKPGSPPGHYAPQGQWYLVSADLNDPDSSIQTGVLAQAKIHCRWRSCAWWVYRTIASTFDLRLI